MIINISDISNTMFNPLKSWAEQSQGNWNILIVSGFVLLFVAGILSYVLQKKNG